MGVMSREIARLCAACESLQEQIDFESAKRRFRDVSHLVEGKEKLGFSPAKQCSPILEGNIFRVGLKASVKPGLSLTV